MVSNPTIMPLTKEQRTIIRTFTSLFQYHARSIDTAMLSTISSVATNMTTATRKNRFPHTSIPGLRCNISWRHNMLYGQRNATMDLFICILPQRSKSLLSCGRILLSQQETKSSYRLRLTYNPRQWSNPSNLYINWCNHGIRNGSRHKRSFHQNESIPIATTLHKLGYVQSPILLQIDNKSAVSILTDTMTQRRYKPIDMRYYWLKDKERRNKSTDYGKVVLKIKVINQQSTTLPNIIKLYAHVYLTAHKNSKHPTSFKGVLKSIIPKLSGT